MNMRCVTVFIFLFVPLAMLAQQENNALSAKAMHPTKLKGEYVLIDSIPAKSNLNAPANSSNNTKGEEDSEKNNGDGLLFQRKREE